MSDSETGPHAKGLARPADPTTGLPVQAMTRKQGLGLLAVCLAMVAVVELFVLLLVLFPLQTPPEVAAERQAARVNVDPKSGKGLFLNTCANCHGRDGRGLPNLGKNLSESIWLTRHGDEEVVDLLREGRGIDDPLNSTGVPMPARGGNSSLTDDDLQLIVDYMRSL